MCLTSVNRIPLFPVSGFGWKVFKRPSHQGQRSLRTGVKEFRVKIGVWTLATPLDEYRTLCSESGTKYERGFHLYAYEVDALESRWFTDSKSPVVIKKIEYRDRIVTGLGDGYSNHVINIVAREIRILEEEV